MAAILTGALALDEAARLLLPPADVPSSPGRGRGYQLHVTGLPAAIVPLVFPEAIVATAGDTAVLLGHFDDVGLNRITRRISLLGG
jgi:hypothetical protein